MDVSLPRIVALVPSCLENWTRGVFANREKRELLKKKFTATLVDGVLDLTDYLTGESGRINLQELTQNTIYRQVLDGDDVESETPYTWLASYQQLRNGRPIGLDAPACFLEGQRLLTRYYNVADEAVVFTDGAQIAFTVTQFPADVTEIPKTLEQDFVIALAAMVGGTT